MPNENTLEKFDWKKFRQGMFNAFSKVQWSKDISSIINVRKLIIYAIVIAGFFGWAYWQGKKSKPVNIDCAKLANTKAVLSCSYSKGDKHVVEFKSGKMYFDEVAVKEGQIPALKPYGFHFKPFVCAGVGTGNGESEKELGLGVSVGKFYRVDLNGYLTDKGFYGGVGYRLTDNCHVVGGYGKDYKNLKERVNVSLKWSF